MPHRRSRGKRSPAQGRDRVRAASRGQSDAVLRKGPTTKAWRNDVRPRIVCSAVRATESVRWSTALIEVLLDELYVADDVEKLLGPIVGLRHGRYPQAIALALVL